MNDTNQADAQLTEDEPAASPLNAESVAQYLSDNPSFLIENPDLLLEMQVALQNNGVVSLTQIQIEQYREKIKQLKNQLDQLIHNAVSNERIYTNYAKLNIEIARVNTVDKLILKLQEYLIDGLGLEDINLLLLKPKEGQEALLSEIQHHALFEKKLSKTPFYLGRLGKIEKETLFPNASANSVALIRIGDDETLGLLAIASSKATHFGPNMDTMLLDFLRLSLNFHVQRLQ